MGKKIGVRLVGFEFKRTMKDPAEFWLTKMSVELVNGPGNRALVTELVGEISGPVGEERFQFGSRSRQVTLMDGLDQLELNILGGQTDSLITNIEERLSETLISLLGLIEVRV